MEKQKTDIGQKFSAFFRNGFRALEITVFIGGSFHLSLVFVVSLLHKNFSYLNPVDFLGISTAFPGMVPNRAVFGLSWLALVSLYIAILGLTIGKGLKIKFVVDTIRTKRDQLRAKIEQIAEVNR